MHRHTCNWVPSSPPPPPFWPNFDPPPPLKWPNFGHFLLKMVKNARFLSLFRRFWPPSGSQKVAPHNPPPPTPSPNYMYVHRSKSSKVQFIKAWSQGAYLKVLSNCWPQTILSNDYCPNIRTILSKYLDNFVLIFGQQLSVVNSWTILS